MKINGNFILRKVAGENVLIPVGETALQLNSMIILDPVAAFIWEGLQKEKSFDAIIKELLERFEVDEQTARADAEEFLQKLEKAELLLV